jgi:iron complex outermembrane receptor protein
MARPTPQVPAKATLPAIKGGLMFLLSGAFWVIPPQLAMGQEADGESTGALEEIIVTATRREENLQNIAIAVNVMDSEYLESQHIDQIKDVIDKSPGTSFTLLNKMQNAYSMRGLSSQTEGAAGDPSILTVTDDVVIVKDYLKGAEFYDLERVEVLRGPQGTSFGRNATAGLIHLISKRPTRDTESFIRAGFGNYGHAEADGYLNSAFGANGAARLAVHYTSHDGYTRDVVRNVDLGAEQNLSLRGSLLFNPSDDLEIYLKAEYSKDDDGAPVRQPRNCTEPQETYTNFIDPCSPWATAGSEFAGSDDTTGTVYNPGEKFYLEREIWNLTGQVFWSINDALTLTSISGFIDGKGGYNMDAAGTPRDLQFSLSRNDSWQFTQELRLDNLASGDALGWLVGLYYLTDDHDQTSGRRWFQENLSVYGPGPLFTPTVVTAVSNNQTESLGVFGELNFDFTERLSGTVGLRYTSDKKDFIISHNGYGRNGPVTNFLLDVPSNWPDPNNPATACAVVATPRAFRCHLGFDNARADDSWDHLSYRASLTYALSDSTMLYGTISEAYKTGGFNGEPQTAADAAIPYDEETALNYELGFKSEWASRFRLNATVFYVEYEDQQINVFRLSESGFSTQAIDNAARSDVLGLEADYLWQVTDNFRLSGNFALMDAELKDTQLRLEPGPISDVSGNRPNNVPEWTGTLVAEYFFELGNGSQIGLRADWRGRSSIYNDVLNSPQFERPGTDIIGARAAWYSNDDVWEVALYGKNLTEEADVLNIGPVAPFINDNPVQFGPPRTYGFTVSYRTP